MAYKDVKGMRFARDVALASLFEDINEYPTQTRLPREDKWVGEYRGYYKVKVKDDGYWKPSSSHYLGRAGGTAHNGIDIYAPYFPFPHEVPILAVISGTVEFRFDDHSPNALGNRAIITSEIDGKKVQLYFGHLSRFHGRSREVEKGEIIGYAGCSGNANTVGECRATGSCKINSGHVHLAAGFGFKKNSKGRTVVNHTHPAKLLGWSLRFDEKSDKAGRTTCLKWLEKHGLTEVNVRAGLNGDLYGGLIGNWKRTTKGRRKPLAKPYELLEFDSTRAIQSTKKAYAQLSTRFDKNDKFEDQIKAGVEKFGKGKETIDDLVSKIDKLLADIKPTGKIGGLILRALMIAYEGLWVLMGGAALAKVATNRGLPSNDASRPRVNELVECGFGVGGEAWVIAVDGGQAALHVSRLHIESEKKWHKYEIVSVSFGAGNLWHATLPEMVMDSVTDQKGKEFLLDVHYYAAILLIGTSRVQKLHRRLRETAPQKARTESTTTLKNELEFLRNRLSDTAKYLDIDELPDDAKEARRAQLKKILELIAAKNRQAFEIAYNKSKKKEKNTPIGPRISFLRLST